MRGAPLLGPDNSAIGPRLHGAKSEAQRVLPAKSPGAGLLLARRGRGAEDQPGHPAGAGVPGDHPPPGAGPGATGRRGGQAFLLGCSFSAGQPVFKISHDGQGDPGLEAGGLVNNH